MHRVWLLCYYSLWYVHISMFQISSFWNVCYGIWNIPLYIHRHSLIVYIHSFKYTTTLYYLLSFHPPHHPHLSPFVLICCSSVLFCSYSDCAILQVVMTVVCSVVMRWPPANTGLCADHNVLPTSRTLAF